MYKNSNSFYGDSGSPILQNRLSKLSHLMDMGFNESTSLRIRNATNVSRHFSMKGIIILGLNLLGIVWSTLELKATSNSLHESGVWARASHAVKILFNLANKCATASLSKICRIPSSSGGPFQGCQQMRNIFFEYNRQNTIHMASSPYRVVVINHFYHKTTFLTFSPSPISQKNWKNLTPFLRERIIRPLEWTQF